MEFDGKKQQLGLGLGFMSGMKRVIDFNKRQDGISLKEGK